MQLTDLTYGIWSHSHPDHYGPISALPKEVPLLPDSGNFADARNTLVWFTQLNGPLGVRKVLFHSDVVIAFKYHSIINKIYKSFGIEIYIERLHRPFKKY